MIPINGKGNFIRDIWDRIHAFPGGRRLFSRTIGTAAPYTGTIDAQVVELGIGYAKVELKDRRKVRNHLSSVHAVALVNLAELAGNLALSYSMPDDARFIVAGISIDYLKKARGTITAECHSPIPATSEKREYHVEVSLRNAAGEEVSRATLRSLVGPKNLN